MNAVVLQRRKETPSRVRAKANGASSASHLSSTAAMTLADGQPKPCAGLVDEKAEPPWSAQAAPYVAAVFGATDPRGSDPIAGAVDDAAIRSASP
jgi:hypothetical protein